MEKKSIRAKTTLYPMPAVLIGAMVDGKPNFMTVAWCGIASHEPPAISVALQRARHTLKGIKAQGVFSVNVPPASLVEKVDFCGLYSGKDTDKSGLFEVFYKETGAPMVVECPINIECTLITSFELGSHVLVIGEIKDLLVDQTCLEGEKIDPHKVDPLIYATGIRKYCKLGPVIGDAFSVGMALKKGV